VLVRFGIVSLEKLRQARPYVVVGAFVIAAVVTPPDVMSQLLLAVPLWLLYELGLQKDKDFSIFDLRDKGWQILKSKEFFAINPNRLIPVLVDGKRNVFEAGTIILHLLRRYKMSAQAKALVPKNWTYDQWVLNNLLEYWCITSLDGKFVANIFGLARITNYFTNALATWWKDRCEPILVKALGDKRYVQGPEFTLSDIYLGYTLMFVNHNGLLLKSHKSIQYYYARLCERPAFKMSNEGSIFKFD